MHEMKTIAIGDPVACLSLATIELFVLICQYLVNAVILI